MKEEMNGQNSPKKRNIKVFCTTLRDGEQSPGCAMSIDDKVKLAIQLNDMKVDVIEAGYAYSNDKDFTAIQKISEKCDYSIITSLARCHKADIDSAYEAIKDAKHKRIHVFIATSDIHMYYKLKKTKEEVKKMTFDMVSYAKSKCDDIEFSLEDGTRTDKEFACEIIDIAIEAGATTINIPDTVGFITPDDYIEFIEYIRNHSRINEVDISVHCHNDLGMATANTIYAVMAGATQVEVTVNGIGERAGNTAMEEVVTIISDNKIKDYDGFECYTNINSSDLKQISEEVIKATNSHIQDNKPIVGSNVYNTNNQRKRETIFKTRKSISREKKDNNCQKNIKIIDKTLIEIDNSKTKEKIELAKALNDMHIDVVEVGKIINNKDVLIVDAISEICDYSTISVMTNCTINEIDRAYESIKKAKNQQIHLVIPAYNDNQEEYKSFISKMIKYSKNKCQNISLSLCDEMIENKEFACEIIDTAISSGVTVINIPDSGFKLPDDYIEFIDYIKEHSRINEIEFSVACKNDSGMSTANTIYAIKAGATSVGVTVNGIGKKAGNTALEEVAAIIDFKKIKDYDGNTCYTNIDLSMIKNISDMVVQITGSIIQSNKAIVGDNAFKHESGIHQDGCFKKRETYEILNPKRYGIFNNNIVIGIHSGKSGVIMKMRLLGYDDQEYDVENISNECKGWVDENIEKCSNIPDEIFCKIVDRNVKNKDGIKQKIKKDC